MHMHVLCTPLAQERVTEKLGFEGIYMPGCPGLGRPSLGTAGWVLGCGDGGSWAC